MREVEGSNPGGGRVPFYRELEITSSSELAHGPQLKPVVNRQVGSHPTVMLDIGMPYPPLEQDSASGALKDRSPCEVASQCTCLPNQERVAE